MMFALVARYFLRNLAPRILYPVQIFEPYSDSPFAINSFLTPRSRTLARRMKACLGVFENAMSTATIEGLGEDMVNFFDQCDGAADGIDFPKAILSSILELEPLLKGLGVDTSEMDATIASLSGDMPSAAPSTAPSKAPSTPSKSSGLVATLGSAAIASAVVGLLI
jgi:hypothetical protein